MKYRLERRYKVFYRPSFIHFVINSIVWMLFHDTIKSRPLSKQSPKIEILANINIEHFIVELNGLSRYCLIYIMLIQIQTSTNMGCKQKICLFLYIFYLEKYNVDPTFYLPDTIGISKYYTFYNIITCILYGYIFTR